MVAAEGEHREGDERLGVFEPERDPGEDADLGVGGLDEALGEAVVEGGGQQWMRSVAVGGPGLVAVGVDEDRDAAVVWTSP